MFNILVSKRRLRHRELRNKGNLLREFDAGDLVVVSKQVKSRGKYGIAQKLVFKTKEPYRFLEKVKPISYWLQSLPFCEGLGRPIGKVKESASMKRRLRHRELRNKGNLLREFDAGDLVVVSKQVKSRGKYGIAQKLVFKTKEPYRFLEKVKPISYWLQSLPFCEGLGRPIGKVKESASMMEKIPSTMIIHKHVYG